MKTPRRSSVAQTSVTYGSLEMGIGSYIIGGCNVIQLQITTRKKTHFFHANK